MKDIMQILPSHAEHISKFKDNYINDMLRNETVIAQLKYDGERMLIHILNGKVYCTSRRASKKDGRFMENQSKLHDFCKELENDDYYKNLGYTVIDCECYSKDWSTIVGIIHSLPDRAYELCKLNTPKFACFDCLYYDGEDITNKPYGERLDVIESSLKNHPVKNMHMVHFLTKSGDKYSDGERKDAYVFKTREEIQHAMDYAVNDDFEGIVIKSLDRKYNDRGALIKCKKFETIDCVVIDKVQGAGKYANTVGALKIGYYDPDTKKCVAISQVNCGTDADRDMWRDNWDKMKNSVLEVKCQEITEKSLRHPVYMRIREDKYYTMCTKDTIFKTA